MVDDSLPFRCLGAPSSCFTPPENAGVSSLLLEPATFVGPAHRWSRNSFTCMSSGISLMNLLLIPFWWYCTEHHLSEYIVVLSISKYYLSHKSAHNFLCYVLGFSDCLSFYSNIDLLLRSVLYGLVELKIQRRRQLSGLFMGFDFLFTFWE